MHDEGEAHTHEETKAGTDMYVATEAATDEEVAKIEELASTGQLQFSTEIMKLIKRMRDAEADVDGG